VICYFQVTKDYEDFAYHRVMNKALLFATTEISALYFTSIKDRYDYSRILTEVVLKFLTLVICMIANERGIIFFLLFRLYCDQEDNQSRRSALFVMNQLYLTLIKTLGPVLPFLTEESYSYYSEGKFHAICVSLRSR